LRDTAESNRDFALYGVYLSTFIPALVTILGDEKTIAFGRESFDHVCSLALDKIVKLILLALSAHIAVIPPSATPQ